MPRSNFKIGKFTLDSLTIGMYDDPLCVYREYIQNAAEAIDEALRQDGRKSDKCEIRITINPAEKSITIVDTGCGVKVSSAEKALLSAGDSEKYGSRERGFRGIGRLGGVAYCDTLVFVTKAKGESRESINTWDCKRIRALLSPSNKSSRGMELRELIEQCTTLETRKSGRKASDSFFRVEMRGVQCAKGVLWDIREVSQYLSEVAPVPFDHMQFYKSDELDRWLTKEIPSYNTYRVFLNDDLIRKPYKQTVPSRGSKTDEITDIRRFDIKDGRGKVIARGWQALRKDNIGQLNGSSGIDSFRVRIGNILLGSKKLLDECFKESRFNGYNIGEIHVVDPELVPNARRDDFEDCSLRSEFYVGIERELGEPLVQDIRRTSADSNLRKPLREAAEVHKTVGKQARKGFVGDAVKKSAITDVRVQLQQLDKLQQRPSIPEDVREQAEKETAKLEKLAKKVEDAKPDISVSLSTTFSKKDRELIQRVLDIAYEQFPKVESPEQLVSKIIARLNRGMRQ